MSSDVSNIDPAVSKYTISSFASVKWYQTSPPLVHAHGTVGPSCVAPLLLPCTVSSASVSVSVAAVARVLLVGRQVPIRHMRDGPHTLPHEPQFALSTCGLMHMPLHAVVPTPHVPLH